MSFWGWEGRCCRHTEHLGKRSVAKECLFLFPFFVFCKPFLYCFSLFLDLECIPDYHLLTLTADLLLLLVVLVRCIRFWAQLLTPAGYQLFGAKHQWVLQVSGLQKVFTMYQQVILCVLGAAQGWSNFLHQLCSLKWNLNSVWIDFQSHKVIVGTMEFGHGNTQSLWMYRCTAVRSISGWGLKYLLILVEKPELKKKRRFFMFLGKYNSISVSF